MCFPRHAVATQSLALSLLATSLFLTSQASGSPELHLGIDPIRFFDSGSDPDTGGPPVGNFRYTHRFQSDFDSLPGDLSSHEFSLFMPLLPLTYDRLRIATFASYRAISFDTSTPTLIPEDTLHAFRLPVVALYELSDRWLLGAMAMPGISGDLSSSSDGFSILSVLGGGYSYSNDLKFFAGAVYSHGFDEDRLFPGLGFSWRPSENLSVNLLPPFASISYHHSEDYKFSLFGRLDSPTWNVEGDSAGPARDITMREIRTGLRLERRVADHFWAYLAGGVTFGRRLEVETLGSASLQEDDIETGTFLQGGLNLRF